MSILYGGAYRRRFRDIIDLLGTDVRSVCDLCFGDTIVADWCRSHGVEWTGVDLNPHFCARARKQGFRVLEGDLFSVDIPPADVFIMAGSLYHFYDRLPRLFDLVWQRTDRFILSEPVRNISSQPGPLGWWARRSANPGDGEAVFRYDDKTLLQALTHQQGTAPFELRVVSSRRDMLVTLERRGKTRVCTRPSNG